ncbi:uncharacterized protein LOC107647481 [Arachis ipaensis]|uniref:uncharacterized protein LOC107647481 n=1 Tax=Arachis ipaensis TaxID=130454 RepID=UPI0007AEEB99|nr:uncharacterized protein LOC107647481 [Arachis ipaensis]XP_025627942.1 uncharacterized protein LOC112721082 [Arachis hypogaea]
MTKESSAIIQRNLSTEKKYPRSFQISCIIDNTTFERALCDLGASINLMPLSMMKRLQIQELKPTKIALQLADKSMKLAHRIVENIISNVGKFFLPVDFVILDMKKGENASIILRRPLLATGRALIDVEKGELMLRVHDEHLIFHIVKTMHHSSDQEDCKKVKVKDPNLRETPNKSLSRTPFSCLERKKEKKKAQQIENSIETNKSLQPKPSFTINKPPDIKLKFGVECASNKEEAPKKKVHKEWKKKKISTVDFSPGEKVMLSHHLLLPYIVNEVLSLEHIELLHEDTGRRFKVR